MFSCMKKLINNTYHAQSQALCDIYIHKAGHFILFININISAFLIKTSRLARTYRFWQEVFKSAKEYTKTGKLSVFLGVIL